jgi:hypothetical protein
MKNQIKHILLALSCLLLASSALANTYLVTSLLDDGSAGTLRYVLSNADSGDTIFLPSNPIFINTITLTQGPLTISNNITIFGGPGIVAISGGGLSQVFIIQSTVTLSDLMIENGSGGNGGRH